MLKHIVYQTKSGPQTDFEFLFNENVLFADFQHQNVFDSSALEADADDAVVVYSSNQLRLDKALRTYLEKSKNAVYFHCSNESLNHSTGYYNKSFAVLRSGGWNPNISNSKVYSVPLAFQSEFYNKNKDSIVLSNRKYAWCFFGSLKGDRQTMYNALQNVYPFYNFQSKGWMDPENKTPDEVITYYKNMVFMPSPAGNIYFECNRTMDALEWGCIPVTTKFLGEDCYRYIYGDHPFIVGDNWFDAANKMNALLQNEQSLYAYQLLVRNWYLAFKKQLSADVAHIVNGKFELIKGAQFQYQKAARSNSSLKWKFFKHFTLNVYWNRLMGKALKSK